MTSTRIGLALMAIGVAGTVLGAAWYAGTPAQPAGGSPPATAAAPAGTSGVPPVQPDHPAAAETTAAPAPGGQPVNVSQPTGNQPSPPPRRRVDGRNVKGIYMSGPAAATPGFRAQLLDLIERTELNGVVIDVKNDWGHLTYRPGVDLGYPVKVAGETIADLRGLLATLNDQGVYTIARLVVFKDDALPRLRPDLAVHRSGGALWTDRHNLTWLDPYSQETWDYNLAIARDAARIGFDEVQFDYVRFPSDGHMADIAYPSKDGRSRSEVISGFLKYARAELAPLGVKVSADVFGVVTHVRDDQGIGQLLEDLAGQVDYLSPMIYPSHYAPGEFGLGNPNAAPYETVYKALENLKERTGDRYPNLHVRPWLQDFNLGYPDYTPARVRAQIQAAYDVGYTSWLLWNAANVYTDTALEPIWQGAVVHSSPPTVPVTTTGKPATPPAPTPAPVPAPPSTSPPPTTVGKDPTPGGAAGAAPTQPPAAEPPGAGTPGAPPPPEPASDPVSLFPGLWGSAPGSGAGALPGPGGAGGQS